MLVTDLISITELSRLTGKSRPTIYKYINEYNAGNYDDIPFSFIKLFDMAKFSSRADIEGYCYKTYGVPDSLKSNEEIKEVIMLISENSGNIDFEKLKKFILEEIKKWRIKI